MDIFQLLRAARKQAASNLHIVASRPPLVRVNGSLRPISGMAELTTDDTNQAFLQITTPEQREYFHQHLEICFAYTLPGVGRLLCEAAQSRENIALALRLLPPEIPTIDELKLPQICKEFALKPRGLVIIIGGTGSGKSTTLAAMLQHINTQRSCRIVTIEDPIEYVHPSLKSAITQIEVGRDALSWTDALNHVMEQDPDVIMMSKQGDLERDREIYAAALTLAERGHLVFTTVRAANAAQAPERFIDHFPPHDRNLIQTRLASILVSVLSQVLVPRSDVPGRIVAIEILIANPTVRNLIRKGKMHQLPSILRTHRGTGMISMDEALVDLYLRKIIASETLLAYCNDRQEVEKLAGRIGVR